VEGQEVLNAISKFGRSFSIVRIPFALKLLIQELQVMNIQMRIITEDNIDQLMNLSYQSRNIDKLLHIDQGAVERDIKEIVENYKKEIDRQSLDVENESRNKRLQTQYKDGVSPQNLEYTPERPNVPANEKLSDEDYGFYETGYSPDWVNGPVPTTSPPYAPGSPAYAPDSNSPQWHPNSSPIQSPQGPINIDDLLVNKEPDKDWEASPPWAPPFENPDKNDIYNQLPRYVQDNIIQLHISDENTLFDVVNEANKRLIKQRSGFSPNTPSSIMSNGEEFTSLTPMSLGPTPEGSMGGANIFGDQYMNNEFNKLGGAQQAEILQLPPKQREGVMAEIIRRSRRQTGGNGLNNTSSSDGNVTLNKAFNALPVHNQVLALQGGYNSMAKEFNSLAKHVPETTTTISRPVPVSVELANKFPLLAVEQKGGDKKNNDESTTSSDNTSSSSSSQDNSSGGGTIKKISF
jgi:hypothetical protein